MILPLVLAAAAAAQTPQPPPPPPRPSARQVVEQQLAARPAPGAGVGAEEAKRLHARYLETLGSAPLRPIGEGRSR